MNIIGKAKQFATEAHGNIKDDDGVAFIFHPQTVASILSLITSNKNLISAAYLHDTIEDTSVTYDDLVREFNKEVADLVFEVTHIKKPGGIGWYFPNIKTRDGMMLKFADRLSNISRMGSWSEKRRAKYLMKSKFW